MSMEISLTNALGKSICYKVDESWTVERLKREYAQEYGTTWTNWYFMVETTGKCLQNNDRLTDSVKDGSIIQVAYRQAHNMKQPVELYVTSIENDTSGGPDAVPCKTILIYADSDWTVQRVKREFAQIKGTSDLNNCKLYFQGCSLKEKMTLMEYHILNEATLHFAVPSASPARVGIRSLKRCILRKKSCKVL